MRVLDDSVSGFLDPVDLNILAELQTDGRLSFKDLAGRIGLTSSSCLRRVRRLEKRGVIGGYSAEITRESMGVDTVSMVMVRLEYYDAVMVRRFEKTMLEEPRVLECQAVSDSTTYLVRFGAAREEDHEHFFEDVVSILPGVVKVTAPMFLREVKKPVGVPISRQPAHSAGRYCDSS